MQKQFKLVLILGILLVLLPLSGLKDDWDLFLASIIGLILVLTAVIHRLHAPSGTSDVQETIYIDNKGHVSHSEPEHDDSEEVHEVEITVQPGDKVEVNIDEENKTQE